MKNPCVRMSRCMSNLDNSDLIWNSVTEQLSYLVKKCAQPIAILWLLVNSHVEYLCGVC
jgi:hypothetical protein